MPTSLLRETPSAGAAKTPELAWSEVMSASSLAIRRSRLDAIAAVMWKQGSVWRGFVDGLQPRSLIEVVESKLRPGWCRCRVG